MPSPKRHNRREASAPRQNTAGSRSPAATLEEAPLYLCQLHHSEARKLLPPLLILRELWLASLASIQALTFCNCDVCSFTLQLKREFHIATVHSWSPARELAVLLLASAMLFGTRE